VQQAELTAGDGVGGDEFGYSIAVSGNTVVVGAPEHKVGANAQQGAVYVFTMGAGGWANATQTAELTDSAGPAGAELGYSVAISGNTIAAGEPAGTELLHDSNPTHSQGTVDVFTTAGAWASTGTPNAQLTESSETDVLGGELGWSVAISGKTIVAGAPFDGTHGDPEGEAFVFTEPAGGWSGAHTEAAELKESDPSGEDHFGESVAISDNTIVAGARYFAQSRGGPEQGVAFVYTESGGGWSGTHIQTAELLASDPSGSDELGYSVGVSGNTVVAGAFNHKVGQESGQGAAYVFAMPGGGWKDMTQTAELTSSEPIEGNALGFSVAISGSTVVAGAPSHQVGQDSDQGIVYVFTEPSGGWVNAAQTETLTASDGTPSDNLGYSVAISGGTIASGAYRHVAGSNTADHGAAYVFGPGSAPSGGSTGGSGNTGKGTTGGGTPTGPTPPPNAHVVSVSGGGGKLTVTLSCPAGGVVCAPVSLEATVKEHLKGSKITAITAGGKKKKAHATTKQLVVASGGVTLAAGVTKALTLTLDSTGQVLLSKFGKLTTVVTVSSGDKVIDTTTVTVQKTKPKKKRKK
jgi:hypothetical protein